MIVPLNDKDKQELIDFCNNVYKKSKDTIEKRGQKDPFKIRCQNFWGKASELFVNSYIGSDNKNRILEVLSENEIKKQAYRPDLIHENNKGIFKKINVKSQPPDSYEFWLSKFPDDVNGRYTFADRDSEDDIYIGILPKIKEEEGLIVFGMNPEEHFNSWVRNIKSIDFKFGFVCPRKALDENVWDPASAHKKDAKILCSSKINKDLLRTPTKDKEGLEL